MHRTPPLTFDLSAGFLSPIDAVLAASPDELYRGTDITAVQLWRLPDGGTSC